MNKAIFLDRDGVINVDHAYVHKIDQFEFVAGVFEACRHFVALGYKLVVVTNQSGIGRGYYSESDFATLTDWMKLQFEREGAPLAGVYFCPHHPKNAQGMYQTDCECRKPAPGMLAQAISEHQIDVTQSIMIGDKWSDIEAGQRAGVARCILIQSQYSSDEQAIAQPDIEIWSSLAQGVDKIS